MCKNASQQFRKYYLGKVSNQLKTAHIYCGRVAVLHETMYLYVLCTEWRGRVRLLHGGAADALYPADPMSAGHL